MEKDEADGLPQHSTLAQHARSLRSRHRRRRFIRLVVVTCLACLAYSNRDILSYRFQHPAIKTATSLSAQRLEAEYEKCSDLRRQPQDLMGNRTHNARYVEGQEPILIRNATVWTGEPSFSVTPEEARAGKGFEWIVADVLLQHGLIIHVGPGISEERTPKHCKIIDAHGRQVTAGIIDMHSHAGVDTLPQLEGSSDDNELSSDITPYVRSIDGLNPLDAQIQVIKSGGVTTSLILPGSGNNIGGEAFVIKHAVGGADGRAEISIADLLADPEHNHRYMKMACGENAKSVYGTVGRDFGPFSRLGEAFYFRHAFEEAAKLKNAQDDWCAAADQVGSRNMNSYLPMNLKWESLSAVLRGQVFVNTHCYTIPDLESFVGYTNEFQFPVRAFHHAHQTYLIPEVLKRAYGGRPPAAALFADNMFYKAESYIASEQAGKILWEAGITPVYVSDNPVINAQHVLLEAAKAYKNGLPYHVALAGVTSASAELLGLGERMGKVKAGLDADLVIWDSDPLSLGATPVQVFIDGVPQLEQPVELKKPLPEPLTAWTPRILGSESVKVDRVAFSGITKVQLLGQERVFTAAMPGNVVFANGSITCLGSCATQLSAAENVVHLQDGHIAPPLTAFGSSLGLEEIAAEDDTADGANDQSSFSAAVDGLALDGKNLKAAYDHGVTRAISAPRFKEGGHKGISAAFRVGAQNALEKGAVLNDTVALHYSLTSAAKQGKTPSLSSAIAELKAKLLKAIAGPKKDEDRSVEHEHLARVVAGKMPLVIDVHSADTIAAILRLKSEVEAATAAHDTKAVSAKLRLVIFGGAESHLLASELAEADIGVLLAPLFAYSTTWEQRRSLTGAPRTNGTAIDVLHAAGVGVGAGVDEDWEARDLYVQAGIVLANGGGKISESDALAFASSRIYDILGLREPTTDALSEFVVFEGNPLTTQSQVRAVADGRGMVDIWG